MSGAVAYAASPAAPPLQQQKAFSTPPVDPAKMTPYNVGPMIQPGDDPAKVEAARQFIVVYQPQIDPKNLQKMLDAYIPRLIEAARKANPKLDEKKLARDRRASITAGAAASLVNQSHVVSRHFTLQELKDLKAFFSGPLGRKITVETPRIKQEMRMAHYRDMMPKPGEKDDDDDARPSPKAPAKPLTPNKK